MASPHLSHLTPASLGSDGEYRALAALALNGDGAAMGALAEHAVDEDAFRWLWAMATHPQRQADAWAQFGRLPEGLLVPDELHDSVRDFLLKEGLVQQPGRQPGQAPWSAAQQRLLLALDPGAPFARAVARAICEADQPVARSTLAAASRVLAQSSDADDRSVAMGSLGSLEPADQVAILLQLPGPLDEAEAQVLADTAVILTTTGAQAPAQLGELVARLDPPRVAALLSRPQLDRQGGRAKLMAGGVVRHLGVPGIQAVLAENPGEAVVDDLLGAAATQLPGAARASIALWAHQNFPDERTEPFRAQYLRDLSVAARRGVSRTDDRAAVVAVLQTLALEAPSRAAIATFASVVSVAELAALSSQVHSFSLPVGKVLADVLERDAAADFEDAMRTVLTGAREADTLPALVSGAGHEGKPLPFFLIDAAIDDDSAIAVLAAAGYGADLVTAAQARGQDEGREVAVVVAAADHLEDEHVASLQKRTTNWRWVDDGDYCRFVEALTRFPSALAAEATHALASLAWSDADMIPPALLVHVLEHVAATGVADEIDAEQRTSRLRELLQHHSNEVVAACAEFAMSLPLDDTVIDVVVAAHDDTDGLVPALTDLRRRIAQRLLDEQFHHPDADQQQRRDALTRAARADVAVARPAAVDAMNAPSIEVRLAAATVLAAHPGAPEDVEQLQALLDVERNKDVRSQLELAVNRVRSGSVGEALHNLSDLLDLPPGNLDPDVHLPLRIDRRDAFAKWVDKARARCRPGSDPGPFIEAAINLADLMVDLAVVASADAGLSVGVKESEVKSIRAHDHGRPDTGALVRRQQPMQQFPWFSAAAALRDKRDAHPMPIGSTQPRQHRPDDMTAAKSLLRDVANGWLRAMETAARR